MYPNDIDPGIAADNDMKHKMQVMDSIDREQQQAPFGSDHFEYNKFLTDTPEIPDHIRKKLWALGSKIHQLTNIDKRDMRIWFLQVDTLFVLTRMSIPRWKYTPELDLEMRQLKLMFYSMLQRSQGGFERKMQATRIGEYRYQEAEQRTPKMGLLGRLFGGGK